MKQFEIVFIRRNESGDKFLSYDKMEANDLVQLLSQFLLSVVSMQNKLHEEELSHVRWESNRDDIPF